MKELELLLKMLESDMTHVKEEHNNYEEKSHPRYSYLKGQMNILNMYIHRVKSQMSLKG